MSDLDFARSLHSKLKNRLFECMPEFRSSHLTEALAHGLGYRTSAAFTSDLEGSQPQTIHQSLFDRPAFAARLSALSGIDAGMVLDGLERTMKSLVEKDGRIVIMVGESSKVIMDAAEAKARATAVLAPILRFAVSKRGIDVFMHHNDGQASFDVRTSGAMLKGAELPAGGASVVEALKVLSNGIYPDASQFQIEVDGLYMTVRAQFLAGSWPGERPIVDLGAHLRLRYPASSEDTPS